MHSLSPQAAKRGPRTGRWAALAAVVLFSVLSDTLLAEPVNTGVDAVATVRSGAVTDSLHLRDGSGGGIAAFTVRWTRGARVTGSAIPSDARAGRLSLSGRDGQQTELAMLAGAKHNGRRLFTVAANEGIHISLSGTEQLRLRVSGLPAGTVSVDLVTERRGTRLVERSARCRDGQRTVVARFEVTHDGETSVLTDRSGTVACTRR